MTPPQPRASSPRWRTCFGNESLGIHGDGPEELARACWSVITKDSAYRRGMLRAAEIAAMYPSTDADTWNENDAVRWNAGETIASAIRAEAGEERQ